MQIASLHVYPVKSCRGISVPGAPMTRTGEHHSHLYVLNERLTVICVR
jgi:uncharacterized protein YcbX